MAVQNGSCRQRPIGKVLHVCNVEDAEPFGGTITHDSMPPNTVVCRSVASRLKTRAGTTVGKSQVYIWLCHTMGFVWAIDIAIVLPNPATGHSLGHSHALVFLLGAPVCKATKSSVFPRVLFMFWGSSSLGGL